MEMAIGIGNLLGGISAGFLIQSIGYMRTACLACVVKVCNITLIFFLPETFQPKKNAWSISFVLQSVKKSFEFYYSKEFLGKRWKYNLTLAIFILGNMTIVGKNQIEILYIINSPFCFLFMYFRCNIYSSGVRVWNGTEPVIIRAIMSVETANDKQGTCEKLKLC